MADLESDFKFTMGYEENGILYPVEIKKNAEAKAIMTSAFPVLDQIPGKERGMGAVIAIALMWGSSGKIYCRYRSGIYRYSGR